MKADNGARIMNVHEEVGSVNGVADNVFVDQGHFHVVQGTSPGFPYDDLTCVFGFLLQVPYLSLSMLV